MLTDPIGSICRATFSGMTHSGTGLGMSDD
jgi:hypothetical protein